MSESGSAGEREPRDPAGRSQPQGRNEQGDRNGPVDHPPGDSDRTQMPDPFAVELMRLADEFGAGRVLNAVVPAWRRRTRGEKRWPVTLTVAVAVVLQMQLS